MQREEYKYYFGALEEDFAESDLVDPKEDIKELEDEDDEEDGDNDFVDDDEDDDDVIEG